MLAEPRQSFVLLFLYLLKCFLFVNASSGINVIRRKDKQDVSLGRVLTWNMNSVKAKLGREKADSIRRIICNVIQSTDVAALQQAHDFYYSVECDDDSFHSERVGQYVTLARKSLYGSVEAIAIDSTGNFLVTTIESRNSDHPLLTVVNTHLPEGVTKVNEREHSLSLICIKLKEFLSRLKRSPVVVILGDFNTITSTDARNIFHFKVNEGDPPFQSLLKYDGRDPFTTTAGMPYNGIVIGESSDSDKEGHETMNFLSNGEPFRFSMEVDRGVFISRLINNWNVAKFTTGKTMIANRLKDCIKTYVEDRETVSCPYSWVSSTEVSDHLPLGLKIVLPSSKTIQLGTWNINGISLPKRLKDSAILAKFRKVFNKFDILVLQKIPKLSSLPPNPAMKILEEIFDITGKIDYNSRFQHGIYISNKQYGNKKAFQEITTAPMDDSQQNKAAFYKFAVSDGGLEVLFCLFSIKFRENTNWKDILKDINYLTNNNYDTCNFVAAMGDFSSFKDGESDIVKWAQNEASVNLTILPQQCSHPNTGFKYTNPRTHQRLDYIFIIKMDSPIGIMSCDVLTTGDEKPATGVSDWLEVSDHYPIQAEIKLKYL